MADVREMVAHDGVWEADAYVHDEMVADAYDVHETAADGDDDQVFDGFVVVESNSEEGAVDSCCGKV